MCCLPSLGMLSWSQHRRMSKINISTIILVDFPVVYILSYRLTLKRTQAIKKRAVFSNILNVNCYYLFLFLYPSCESFLIGWFKYNFICLTIFIIRLFLEIVKFWSFLLFIFIFFHFSINTVSGYISNII